MAKLGRPREYTKEGARRSHRESVKKYSKNNYEVLTVLVPIGLNEKIKECVKTGGIKSKRQFVINAIEEYIKKILNIS